MNHGNLQLWTKPPEFIPTTQQIELARQFDVDPLIIYLIELRNISGADAIDSFLNPSLANLPDPFTIKDMDSAVALVSKAIRKKSAIVIWGDYDVDGITSTCLLVDFFRKIGIKASWKIPNRFSEGYGINNQGIEKIRDNIFEKFPLLITVDCGISNHQEIKRAKELGFKVIVTDHHQPPDTSVPADAILNVKQKGCHFADKNLAGVGVAFYLVAGIRSQLKQDGYFNNTASIPNLKQFLDLVAIGTIADMVSLSGVNRILTKAGLEVIASDRNIGISALLKESEIFDSCMITSDDIMFQVAPKINAAGRMESADTAINLLLCSDENEASRLAKNLKNLNEKRKNICSKILESTLSIDDNFLIYNNNCIIIHGDFHQGVLGIVASQLVGKYHLPVVLLTYGGLHNGKKILKGSGRSVAGVNIFEILIKCERFLLKFGGHSMAAGLSLFEENLDLFRERFSQVLTESTRDTYIREQYIIDVDFPVDKLFDEKILLQLQRLEPFGVGNRKPVFMDSKALVYDYQTIGHHGNHLKVLFRGKYANRKGVGFNLGNRKELLQGKTHSHIIYTPSLNRFKNSVSWEIRLLDIF
jgi:single-stranded-DNA-specific exonuclease